MMIDADFADDDEELQAAIAASLLGDGVGGGGLSG